MKKLPYLMFATFLLSSCAHHAIQNHEHKTTVARFIAGDLELEEDHDILDASLKSPDKMRVHVQSLSKKIFQSYLQGQVLLKEFDKKLDKMAKRKKMGHEDILMSDVYADLLATRHLVDGVEDKMQAYYLFFAKVAAYPKSSAAEKANADLVLKEIGNFLSGNLGLKEVIPTALRTMILSNIIEKQTTMYEILLALESDESFTLGDQAAKEKLHELQVMIRATRRAFDKEVRLTKIDEKEFDKALRKERKKADFHQLQREIEALGDEMLVMQEEARRIPSAENSGPVIFPSAGAAGNLTGNGFPEGTWSITYDDGPGGKTSPTVLQNLKDKGLKATFFVLAQQIIALPKIATSIRDAGMDIASHSYTHAQLTKLDDTGLEKEIATSKKTIESKLGIEVKLFRLPYGAGTAANSPTRKKIADNNMVHVFWNVDTLDWQDKNPDLIVERTLKQMSVLKKDAGIVLFHDIHAQSVVASAKLMDIFKTKKTKVCTVQAVIDQLNGGKDCAEVPPEPAVKTP